jgi:hypothetical protein
MKAARNEGKGLRTGIVDGESPGWKERDAYDENWAFFTTMRDAAATERQHVYGHAARGVVVPARGLLGEDHAPSLAPMSYLLQGFRSTTVMALDGRAGVVVAERESPDVMPIDLQTPIINGAEPFVSEGGRFISSALGAH